MWLVPVVTTALVTALIVKIASFNKYVEIFVSAFIIYTTLSTKCLKDEATKIYNVLETGDIKKSREQLSYIVGRDTTNLSQSEIIRAAVETVAPRKYCRWDNFTDVLRIFIRPCRSNDL